MGLRDLAKRMSTDRTGLDNERLHQRFDRLNLVHIDQVGNRQTVKVGGEVKRLHVAPRHGVPSLEVVICDGTGDAVAVFTGRRSIGGIEHGRALVVEGLARDERGRRVMMNPAYTLVAD
jgi:RecG-like helicase